MKKTMTKIALILTVLSLFVLAFSGCSSSKKPTIGIIQFGSHASLNNCYEGTMKGLKDAGIDLDAYTVEYLNSNFDPSVSQTQANRLVNQKADVIIAIATPSAVAAANAAADSDVPVVYCAVTDATVMANYKNVTGSSDIPNFEKQLEVVTAVMGKSDLTIGVLSSTEESSSPVQVESLKKAAEKYTGMSVVSGVVSDITTIDTKVNDLINQGVDCIVNLLDNTIVGKLQSNILPITNEHKIPVFGSEIEQVKLGCVASSSIDYINVGALAGESAAKVLNGTAAGDIPVSYITEPTPYYNAAACEQMGLTVPETLGAVAVDK